jgi:predicted membrane protein
MLVASIILQGCVAAIAVLAAQQRRPYLYGLAFTFAAYVLYDIARFAQWNVEGPVLSWLFLIAAITAFVAVVGLYWDRGGH